MPRLIEAKYSGWCSECGDPIEPGDLIGFDLDGKVVCETCRVEMTEPWQYEPDDDEDWP